MKDWFGETKVMGYRYSKESNFGNRTESEFQQRMIQTGNENIVFIGQSKGKEKVICVRCVLF